MKFTKTVIAALAIGASVAAHAEGIEWSGFGSLYYSQSFDENFLINQMPNNKPDFTSNSLVGFNVGSRISEKMSFASQLVMAGSGAPTTDFKMFAQWAYVTYKPVNSVSFKLGRQLWPMMISSEYQRVHYLLPQASVPGTMYGLSPFVSFDGASLNKTMDAGIGSLTLGAFAGAPKLNRANPTGLDFEFTKIKGIRATLDGSGWRLHATASQYQAKMTVSYQYVDAASPYGTGLNKYSSTRLADIDLYSFGYRYDKHNIVSWGEMFALEGKNNEKVAAQSGYTSQYYKFYEKSYGGYLLAGYRFGRLLPTVTVSQGFAGFGFPSDPNTNQHYQGKVTSYIVGNTYQMNDQATFKVEYQRSYIPSLGGGFFEVTQAARSTKLYGDMVKAGVDFIF